MSSLSVTHLRALPLPKLTTPELVAAGLQPKLMMPGPPVRAVGGVHPAAGGGSVGGLDAAFAGFEAATSILTGLACLAGAAAGGMLGCVRVQVQVQVRVRVQVKVR